MPIYEYRCSACGHELEALQKITETPLVSCPSCRADALTKLVSAAGFQLKGSGWYATDFRNGGKPAAKPESKTDAMTGAATDGAKSDGAKSDGAKSDGAKSDGAKSDGAKSDGAKSNGAKSNGKSEAKTEAAAASGGSSCARH